MFERFTRDARAVVVSTQELCHDLGADEVSPLHLLLALTENGTGVRRTLADHGVTTEVVAESLGVASPPPPARLGDDDAAALRSLGIDLDAIRAAVERQFGPGALEAVAGDPGGEAGGTTGPGVTEDGQSGSVRRRTRGHGHVRFGRGAKKVLELAVREAVRAGCREIRSEHIALGVLRTDDPAVRMVVRSVGIDSRALRADLEDRGRRSA